MDLKKSVLLLVIGIVIGSVGTLVLGKGSGDSPKEVRASDGDTKPSAGKVASDDNSKKPQATAADNSNASARKPYQVRLVVLSNGYVQMVRIKTDSGEAWVEDGPNWKKIPEADPPGPGDYDVQLESLAELDYFAVRVDHSSGRTWTLKLNQWEERRERRAGESP